MSIPLQPRRSSQNAPVLLFPLIAELELRRAGLQLLSPVGLLCRAFCKPHAPDARQSGITAQMK